MTLSIICSVIVRIISILHYRDLLFWLPPGRSGGKGLGPAQSALSSALCWASVRDSVHEENVTLGVSQD